MPNIIYISKDCNRRLTRDAGGGSAQSPFSATRVRAASTRVSETARARAGRQGQLARAWRAAIRTDGALCADRARLGTRLRQRRLPGRIESYRVRS